MQSLRQSELFASKDWLVLYQAFNTINFNASDPTSINQALRDYLAINYPEDFNDWIESSEFVAIIDLLSWLAGTLAFKTDINARENFLETAEARESVLRLARFLSYTPRRNRPATGLVKIVEVSTDDEITDSTGVNLAGVKIQWNNPDDPDWFERFTTVMNSALMGTNQYGTPLKTGIVRGTKTHLYRINSLMGGNTWSFNSSVNGENMDFELCNGDFNELGAFEERIPDNNAAFNLFYRNDGNGNGSVRTGFFMLFKQGSSVKQNFRIDFPTENQILDISTSGVNEDDIWVQTVTDDNFLIENWTKVPSVFSSNITYNDIPEEDRNIFSVISREEDRVSVRFSDGIFGNAPVGNIRVWHRVSNGKFYQIRPTDINRITQTIQYYNKAGVLRNLRVVYSLQETVANSTPRETNNQIKERAPSVYATQNRMVSGEDYNVFPLSSNLASKIKAVNRIYSGHSRFVDLNDPTSTYTDVVVTADDGMLFKESANLYEEIPLALNRTPTEMVTGHLQPFLRNLNIKSYIYNDILTRIDSGAVIPDIDIAQNTRWTQVAGAKYSSSGYFNIDNIYFKDGASLKFQLPNNTFKWVSIASLNGQPRTEQPLDGIRGPVTLSEDIPTTSRVVAIIPAFSPELSLDTLTELAERFDDTSDLRGFSLWFDPETSTWITRDEIVPLTSSISTGDIIHVLTAEYYAGSLWKLSARGLKYVFESARKVRWYFNGDRILDSETGAKRYDTVSILKSNSNLLDATGAGIVHDRTFTVSRLYYNADGSQEPRRIQLDYLDSDVDGSPDDPEAYAVVANGPVHQSTLFWQIGDSFGQVSYKPNYDINVFTKPATSIADVPDFIRMAATDPLNTNIAFKQGDLVYMTALDAFFRRVGVTWVEMPRREFKVARGRGPNTAKRWMVTDPIVVPDGEEPFVVMYSKKDAEVALQELDPALYLIKDGGLTFKWKHYAPSDHRIDPSITNIIDIFMLTSEYDFATRLWIANGAVPEELPKPPTELDLRIAMKDYENFKMFSDEVVWRPVTYKFLFGESATEQNLRVRFKVVKLANTTLADGEIKSQIINAVNEFFDVNRWDFGETFFYTELAAFIHQQLAGQIGSVVIVPLDEEASFGDGFEVKCRSDEIFISTAQVTDVEIINSNTSSNLRIR